MKNKKKYDRFLLCLKELKEEKLINCLHRGMDSSTAFSAFKLTWGINSIEQFAERLFFFGEKSKMFWNEDLKKERNIDIGNNYPLNDVSDNLFKYIFDSFNFASTQSKLKETQIEYIARNEKAFSFFKQKENNNIFIEHIKEISEKEKSEIKEHYLVVLHQFGASDYNDNSHYVSSSKSYSKAEWYSKEGIVINFWDTNVTQNPTSLPSNSKLPVFIGKPFKNDKEISLFACIFPHYIYSFYYKGETYVNPAIFESKDFRNSILNGLEIDQKNFEKRLKEETSYSYGVSKLKYEDEYSYTEIGKIIDEDDNVL